MNKYLFILLLFIGCTTSVTYTREPIFIGTTDSLQTDLQKVVTSENIDLHGKAITSNDKTISELDVSITNGKNIPKDETEMIALGETIATTVKNYLKDQKEYDGYIVYFVTREISGGTTKKTWKSVSFPAANL